MINLTFFKINHNINFLNKLNQRWDQWIYLNLELRLSKLNYFYIETSSFIKLGKNKRLFFKNINSSTSQKKLRLYVFPSLWHFKKILPNTFISESILIKIYMNTNVMNTQIFYFNKYDLKCHRRSQKIICLS
jgi:hypothetical protein